MCAMDFNILSSNILGKPSGIGCGRGLVWKRNEGCKRKVGYRQQGPSSTGPILGGRRRLKRSSAPWSHDPGGGFFI